MLYTLHGIIGARKKIFCQDTFIIEIPPEAFKYGLASVHQSRCLCVRSEYDFVIIVRID